MSTMVIDELITLLGFKLDKSQLVGAEKALEQVQDKIGDVITEAAGLVVAFFGIEKGIEALKESFHLAAEMESMTMQFKTMLGDLDAAKYLVQEIQAYSMKTPYTTMELADQVRLMMAFGMSANQAMHTLQLVGDVAGADKDRMQRLAYAMGQVTSQGALQGHMEREMVFAGFNPLQELAQMTHKSMGQLRQDMAQGKISAEMVTQAFEHVTGPGGKFFNHMEEQSKTMIGLWSTLKDRFQIMMIGIGDSIMPYVKAVVTALIPMVDAIAEAYNQLEVFFGLFFSDGPSAEDTANGIAAVFMTIADVLMVVGVGVQVFRTVLDGIMTVVMGLLTGIVTFFTAPFAIITHLASLAEEKIAGILRHFHVLSGIAKYLTGQGIEAEEVSNTAAVPARYLGSVTGEFASQTGEDWEKGLDLSFLIGGNAKNPNPQVKATDAILAKLAGSQKVINNNIHNEVTIHAEGGFKDLLKEGANSVFSLTFGEKFATRLVAATA